MSQLPLKTSNFKVSLSARWMAGKCHRVQTKVTSECPSTPGSPLALTFPCAIWAHAVQHPPLSKGKSNFRHIIPYVQGEFKVQKRMLEILHILFNKIERHVIKVYRYTYLNMWRCLHTCEDYRKYPKNLVSSKIFFFYILICFPNIAWVSSKRKTSFSFSGQTQ